MKTNKAITKRVRFTKNGKMLTRQAGQNHFNAKESRSKQMAGKRAVALRVKRKVLSRLVPRKTHYINS